MNQDILHQLKIRQNDEEEEEEEEKPEVDKNPAGMWAKKQDEMFFKNRAVYLWGRVGRGLRPRRLYCHSAARP